MNDIKLSILQQVVLRCLMRKLIKELPTQLALKYRKSSLNNYAYLLHCCRDVTEDVVAWNSLPAFIDVEDGDFSEVFNELKLLGCEIEGVHVQHSSFSKDALREELNRYLNHFEETVTILDEEDKMNVGEVGFFPLFGISSSSSL